MDIILQIHALFGERVLPVLIILAAIWFTVTWKPDAGRTLPGRIFPVLVMIQFGLGLIYWVYGLMLGYMHYLGFPFILHPILGLLAVFVAVWAVKPDPPGILARMGRWAPLAALALLFVIVMGSIITALQGGSVLGG
jgi:hypothetical protein